MIQLFTTNLLIDKQFIFTLIQSISKAKKEILIATYALEYPRGTHTPLINAFHYSLAKAAEKGVKIRILTNTYPKQKTPYKSNIRAGFLLAKKNIILKGLNSTRIIHAKYILIDNTILIAGSHNISERAFSQNHELSLFTIKKDGFEALRKEFSKLWTESV